MEKIYLGVIDYASAAADPAADPAAALSGLGPADLDRARAMSNPKARAAFAAGRRALAGLLAEAGMPAGAATAHRAEGKPFLPGHPGIHFNISHSGSLAVAALAGGEVGVDIEVHNPRRDWRAIAARFFHPAEAAAIAALQADAPAAFFRVWTLKEAWLKQSGVGLAGLAKTPQFIVSKNDTIAIDPPPESSGGGGRGGWIRAWRIAPDSAAVYSLALAVDGPASPPDSQPLWRWPGRNPPPAAPAADSGWLPLPFTP